MSLRILFADDSVTAQNMGKKILTDAGYEVVAVSNGAAAVKKIAEQKPDIIILDVYMPGYSGLEVCEKVRGSMETMKTPVLLTVGKMEPYKSEDGNRVRADGVIVKPFEASDLLAIVKKFEERINHAAPPPPPLIQQKIAVDRFEPEAEEAPPELPVEQPVANTAPQPTVDVPDHMATSSAFSDLLGGDSPDSVGSFNVTASTSAYEPPPPPAAVHTPVPDYELPVSWRREREEDPVVPPPPTVAVQEATKVAEPEPPPPPPRPLQIPVYQEREESASAYEFEPTSIPAPENIEIPEEPALLETAAETTRNTVADVTDPGLMTTRQQFEDVPTFASDVERTETVRTEETFVPAGFQDIPAEIAAHAPVVESAPSASHEEGAASAAPSEADFEARVAAALAAYSQAPSMSQGLGQAPAPEPAIPPAAAFPPQPMVQTPAAETMESAPAVDEPFPGVEPSIEPTSPEPPVEYYPLVRETPAVEIPSAFAEPIHEPAPIEEARTPSFEDQPLVSATVEAPPAHVHVSELVAPVPVPEPEPTAEAEAPVPTFEYHPPVVATVQSPPPEAETFTSQPLAETYPAEAAPAPASAAASSSHEEAVVAEVATALPAQVVAAVAAETEPGADHQSISQAVHRVMERLKPELVEEILRELKSKK